MGDRPSRRTARRGSQLLLQGIAPGGEAMIVHQLHGPPPPELARALAGFESEFTYPLGPDSFFHISHGDDYPRFFRAMGEAACFVAQRRGDGTITGTLGAAR